MYIYICMDEGMYIHIYIYVYMIIEVKSNILSGRLYM
jgi:hypothetical protein